MTKNNNRKRKNHSQEMNNKADELLTLVGEKLKFSNPEDANDVTGKNIAGKLRTLDPMMRIYAEKIIYDALFEAQLGTLNRYARIEIPQISDQNSPKSAVNNSITDKSIHNSQVHHRHCFFKVLNKMLSTSIKIYSPHNRAYFQFQI